MEHIWEIHNLKKTISEGLILTASYYCKTEYLDESARSVGEVNLPYKAPSDPDFISYGNLTEAIVLSWVTGSLDTASMYSEHSASIAERITYKNSITTEYGIPWE